jgi:Uma2 family endonuclease
LNIAFAAREQAKGGPSRVFVFDLKVRLGVEPETVFYYPDVMVGCDPRDTHKLYLRFPKLLVEVASPSTERLDRGEKKSAYQTIETLEEYAIVAQDRIEVTLFRRANHWQPELWTRLDDSVRLNSIALSMPLSFIYEGAIPSMA